MERNHRMAGTALLVAALLTSLFFVGYARAHGPPAYVGTFTLTKPDPLGQGGPAARDLHDHHQVHRESDDRFDPQC
jgi:hypothetical protein